MDDSTQIPLPTSFFLPHRSYLGWKIVITIFHLFAASSTIYRLVHRHRIGHLWWDDHILLGGLILDFAYWPVYWARFPSLDNPSKEFVRTQQILTSYWIALFPWFLVLGSTRVSMALSLARIFPPSHQARHWAFILVWFLILTGIGAIISPTVTCKPASALLVVSEMRDCILFSDGIPLRNILIFMADVLSDLSLIITPLVFFWRIKLPAQERRLILIFFCGSSLTLLSAIMYAVIANSQSVTTLQKDGPLVKLGLGAIEASMSFMACNAAVISTCFYQALRRFRHRERPVLESTVETARVPPSRECTCVISDHITQLTLTEISNSNYESDLHDMLDTHPESLHDSAAASPNSKRSFPESENNSSQYTTTQNSYSQYSDSHNSHSQNSRSTSGSKSYLSRSTNPSNFQRSLSASDSYISSNHAS